MNIKVTSEEERELIAVLEQRRDPEAERIKRFLAMPDLSRTAGSPLAELIKQITALPRFECFDVIQVPEIVPYGVSFDLFDFPPEHPARSKSDTYFIDGKNILRTHTTVMWHYWLKMPEVKSKIEKGESTGALCHGKVYRKDEIDRNHMNVFHQMDGWYLCRKDRHVMVIRDLQDVLAEIARAVFGDGIGYRFNDDRFPYTEPSLEMEVKIGDRWIEVLGAGIVKSSVLNNLGVDPDKYNGWAFGFGLERLAIISMDLPDIRLLWSHDERVKKQLKLGRKYQEVSKFPSITRDISFAAGKDFIPNDYFDLIRDSGGDLVERVELIDKYEDSKKFGPDKTSYTYRIVYRSMERTLKSGEVDEAQDKIYRQTAVQFNALLR